MSASLMIQRGKLLDRREIALKQTKCLSPAVLAVGSNRAEGKSRQLQRRARTEMARRLSKKFGNRPRCAASAGEARARVWSCYREWHVRPGLGSLFHDSVGDPPREVIANSGERRNGEDC